MNIIKSIWVIANKNNEFVSFGSKTAWISETAAKNAFSMHMMYWDDGYRVSQKIENSTEYRLVEIKAESYRGSIPDNVLQALLNF